MSTVDRGCSPFRYSELSPLGIQTQAEETADTWRPRRTISPLRPRCSFAKSTMTGSDLKTSQYRHEVFGSLGVQPTNICRNTSQTRAFDYRRDALERKRHLEILESNRTLEKFMRVLREEKQARATAALFSALCNRRISKKHISFELDEESRPVTSSRAGTGSTCLRENRPEVSTIRCSSPIGRQSTYDYCTGLRDKQRHQSGALRSSYTRDGDEDWTKYRYERPRHVSTPRPFS